MKAEEKFTYNDKTNEYVVKLKKRNYWWLLLLLLLLLPLILLIPLSKDITLKTINSSDKSILTGADVKFDYIYYNLISGSAPKHFEGITNENGLITFQAVPYTVYSLLFKAATEAEIIATGGCFMGDSIRKNFHSLPSNHETDIELDARAYNLEFRVIDMEDGQPIPDAQLNAQSPAVNPAKKWEKKSEANGDAELEGVYWCSDICVAASKYGYEPDSLCNKIEKITGDITNRTLMLKPVKGLITFTVKDLRTKQPVPNTIVSLIIKNDTIKIQTNTNGVGKGVFENIHIIAQMQLKTSQPFYYDTITPVYQVDAYNKMTEEERTILIRPKTQSLVFRDIDAVTGEPIAGTKNEIYINGKKQAIQTSNSLGTFSVSGIRENDIISIIAIKSGYNKNDYTVKNKKGEELTTDLSRDIPLGLIPPPPPPITENKPKENCRVHFSGTLLSDYTIKGHISTIYVPDEYGEYVGDGEYSSAKKAFPKAHKTTFDGIAVDKGTRLIIYSGENFTGSVVLDITGPAVINNVKWQTEARIKDFQIKNFAGNLQANYPSSCRQWSKENMHTWSNGSIKIICKE